MPFTHHAEAIYRALIGGVTLGLFEIYSPVAGTIKRVDLLSLTPPSGGDAIFDVNTHATIGASGITIFASPADRPKILSGATQGNVSGLNAAVTRGQKISIDVDLAPSNFGAPIVCIIGIEEAGTRTVNNFTTSSLANDTSEDFTLPLGFSYVVLKIETDYAAWVRVYNSLAAQSADSGRSILVDPDPGAGVIAEVITTSGDLIVKMSPEPIGSNQETSPSTTIPVTVTNKSGASHAITVTITTLELEL